MCTKLDIHNAPTHLKHACTHTQEKYAHPDTRRFTKIPIGSISTQSTLSTPDIHVLDPHRHTKQQQRRDGIMLQRRSYRPGLSEHLRANHFGNLKLLHCRLLTEEMRKRDELARKRMSDSRFPHTLVGTWDLGFALFCGSTMTSKFLWKSGRQVVEISGR